MRLAVFDRQALGNQLVVSVKCAIEQDQRGARDTLREIRIHLRATRNVEERLWAGEIAHLQPERIARLRAERRTGGLVLHVERDLAGDREGLHRDAGYDRDAPSERQGDVRYMVAVEHIENGIGRQRRQHALGGEEAEGKTFTQAEQTGHVIDIAVGQHHRRDRAGARFLAVARRQLGRRLDLLAQVRRSIEQGPALIRRGLPPARTACGASGPACRRGHRHSCGNCNWLAGSRRRPPSQAP